MQKSIRTWVVAVALLLFSPWAAEAAGLGRLTINSALGQPLKAEIELVAVKKDEIGALVARLASRDAFQQANIEYTAALLFIKFSIEMRPDGQPYVKLTSMQPINDPFVSMLVELNWSSGRLLREYTFLLDPPESEAAKPAAPVVQAAPAPQEKPGAVEEKPAARAPAGAAVTAPATAGATYGPVKRGDTLGKIARNVIPEGVNLDQMLVALYRANHDAFSGNNMNRLKTGPILRVPEANELATVDRQEAAKEVRVQASSWNVYRQKLAAAVGGAPAAEAPKQAAAGKITTTVEEKAAAAKEPAKEVLKLSKGEAPGGKDVKSLQERVRAMEEERTAREKALKEAKERVALLEKNIKEMQRLLELKSPGMAQAQKQAEAKPGVTPSAPAPAPEQKAATPPAKPAEAKPEPPKPAKPKPVMPAPPPAPSFMDMLMDNILYLGGAVVVLILGAAGIVFARRKKQATERFEPGGTVVTPAGAAAAGAITPAFGKAEGVQAAEVDALEEAKVYLDYGRDVQAEEILKEALAKNPNRPEVMAKLLEVYALRKDKSSFYPIALQLQAAVGGAGPLWDHALALGHSIDPGNPLYGGAKEETQVAAGGAAPTPDIVLDTMVAGPGKVDFDLGFGAPAAAVPAPVPEVKAEAGSGLDFDLGAIGAEAETKAPELVAAPEAPAPESSDLGLVFDISAPPGAPAPEAPAPAAAPEAAPDLGISFSLEMPEEAKPPAAAEPAPAPAPEVSLGDISFSFDEAPAGAEPAAAEHDSHWQDVATKLDLAKAYQEMGDKDGAKEILEEVLREGDARQQEDAKALLASLA